jgi:acyl carrier protein
MLRRDQALRDQIDLDSMDYLRFVVALHDRLGVDVPESDYPQLGTLDGIIRYLTTRRARVGV